MLGVVCVVLAERAVRCWVLFCVGMSVGVVIYLFGVVLVFVACSAIVTVLICVCLVLCRLVLCLVRVS